MRACRSRVGMHQLLSLEKGGGACVRSSVKSWGGGGGGAVV